MAAQRKKRRLHGWRVLAVVLLVGVVALAVLAWRIYRAGGHDGRVQADVIIVLGAAQYDGTPSPVYRARLDHAINLWHAGYARYLLCTGGSLPGDRFTEAAAGKRYAMQHGVPGSAILLEPHGRTTWQSMQAAAAILRAHRLRQAILVSDPFHAFRLQRMARDLGMVAVVSPAAHSRIRSPRIKARYILREVATYALYRLFGI